jgi:acyl phosphate:glycerol-3-phosphate acyltransferase
VSAMLQSQWLWLLIGYLLGSIPFGLVLTRLTGAGDLRAIGSGNIGATNVLRTGRKGLAAATLILDAAKGALAVLLAGPMSDMAPFAAIGAFLGHLYPVWIGFRGGKGVATLLGIALAYYWPSGLAFAVVWLGVAAISRYSSLAGMSAAAANAVTAAAIGRLDAALLFTGMAILLIWKHRENLHRLVTGRESRIGKAKAGGLE